MEKNINHEYPYKGVIINGFVMLIAGLAISLLILKFSFSTDYFEYGVAVSVILIMATLCGLFVQQPNEASVVTFFGKYVGTTDLNGFYWLNPFCLRRKISLRIRNMDIEPIKVNDKVGNPVLIGMVLVWRIRDTYRVVFDLDRGDDCSHFVAVQSDAALREVTGKFAYDNTDERQHDELTLRGGGEEINNMLEQKINERLSMAGIEVVEARLNYLAYAPEIAAVMLRRQQAAAIITAREKIVEGAVTMVEMALNRIESRQIVKLSDEKKADMVGNLLLILCGDDSAQPVINTNSR